MRNLRDCAHYRDNVLDAWNDTALLLQEAVAGEAIADRPRMLLHGVVSLSNQIGASGPRRANLLKAAEIVMASLHLDSPAPHAAPPKPASTVWRKVKRAALVIGVVLVAIIGFAAGFAANIPSVSSNLPFPSTPAKPSNTPEDVLRQLVEAIPRKDWQRVLDLYHPIIRKKIRLSSIEMQVHDIAYAFKRGVTPQVRIEGIEAESKMKVFVSVIVNEQKVDTELINLWQDGEHWFIESIE